MNDDTRLRPTDVLALQRFREKLDREVRSGLVTILMLLVVDRRGPVYGYRLLQTLREASGDHLAFKEGTAYPLLANLEKAGLLSSFWGTGSGGPPRKYYETTALGRSALDQALEDWFGLIGSVERLIRTLDDPVPDSDAAAPERLSLETDRQEST